MINVPRFLLPYFISFRAEMSGFSRVFHKNKNITKPCDSFSELFNKQKKLSKSGPVANSQKVTISQVVPLASNLPNKNKPNSRI